MLHSCRLSKVLRPACRSLVSCRQHYSNLQSFLDAYQIGLTVLVKQQDFYELGAAYLEAAAANNITHTEIFFDVQSHVKR